MIMRREKLREDVNTQAIPAAWCEQDRIHEVVEKGRRRVPADFWFQAGRIRAKKIETADDKAVDF